MIQRLRVCNFLSLKDTTIELGPFAVFIGPNGSGKTAVFKALVTLSKLLRAPVRGRDTEFRLGPGSPLDRLVWQGDDSLPVSFEVWLDDSVGAQPQYTLELRKVGAGWSVTREVLQFADYVFDSSKSTFEHQTEFRGSITWKTPYPATLSHLVYPYHRDPSAVPLIAPFVKLRNDIGATWRYRVAAGPIGESTYPLKERPGVQPEIYVREDGSGLAWVLRRLQGENHTRFDDIEQSLKRWYPYIVNINFEEVAPGGVRLAFTTSHSRKLVPAELEADGVLHALFLLWRLHTMEPNTTVCLEEPENGTHPHLLKTRYEFIKGAMGERNAIGCPRVYVSTHSPDFIGAIDQGEAPEIIRVVEYSCEEGTKVYRLRDLNDVDKLLEVFRGNLGELWWSGAIGGVPRTE